MPGNIKCIHDIKDTIDVKNSTNFLESLIINDWENMPICLERQDLSLTDANKFSVLPVKVL